MCGNKSWVISSLAKAGLNWTDLCIHQISQLPDLKDSTLKARQEKAEKDAKEKAEKERIAEEKGTSNGFEIIEI